MHGAFPIYISVIVQDVSDLAAEYRDRWQIVRGVLDAQGISGCWNWTARLARPDDLGSNPMTWISPCENLFGAGPEPRTFSELLQRVAPSHRERVAAAISLAVESRGDYTVDYELAGRDGSLRSMRSVGCYVEGKSPRDGRMVGIELEIQPRQSDERRDGVYRSLIDLMEVPVATIDRALKFRYVNPAFAALARGAAAPLDPDHPVLDTVADPVRQRRLAEALARTMKGERSVFEAEFVDERGQVSQWLDFHLKPIVRDSGVIEGAMVVGYDVTPLKRANLYRQRLNAELRQRLDHRAANIDAANRDLSHRVATACEDLRSTLRQLRSLVDGGGSAAASGAGIKQILTELSKMESRVESLGKLSDVALRRPEPRRIDMNRLVREVLRELGHMFEGRTIEFEIESLPHVVADRALVREVLRNLLSNAIKFTNGCAAPRVRVWASADNDTTVWSVADNGIGFDPKHADEMFSAFVRRGTTPRGSGLSIAWRAIQQLRGQLWCESAPGQGATFRFTLGGEPAETI
jgi:signal transduction histidine kinase